MGSLGSLLTGAGTQACPVCADKECKGFRIPPHPKTYPFLHGGYELVDGEEGVDYVIAPHAIEDTELGKNVYGAQDRVPMADAIKYGLVVKTAPRKSKKAPAASRVRKSAGNR